MPSVLVRPRASSTTNWKRLLGTTCQLSALVCGAVSRPAEDPDKATARPDAGLAREKCKRSHAPTTQLSYNTTCDCVALLRAVIENNITGGICGGPEMGGGSKDSRPRLRLPRLRARSGPLRTTCSHLPAFRVNLQRPHHLA